MKKIIHIAGHAACFIALFAMLGGHWLTMQSVAWTRMVMEFSEHESFISALAKTFDGQHPCNMCLQVREGRQQEDQPSKAVPVNKLDKMPDIILDNRQTLLPNPPVPDFNVVPTVPRLHANYQESPPKPPPRQSAAA